MSETFSMMSSARVVCMEESPLPDLLGLTEATSKAVAGGDCARTVDAVKIAKTAMVIARVMMSTPIL